MAKDDQLALGYDLLQRFRRLLEARDLSALDEWLGNAKGIDLPTVTKPAGGIEADRAAVEAAFRLSWSNRQLEGQANRVKLIMGQGYGRAKFDLLRRRVLAAW